MTRRSLVGVALASLIGLAGCQTAPIPAPGATVQTIAGIQVGVIYAPPGPGLARWIYEVEDKTAGGKFDRIAITTTPACATLSEVSAVPTTITPSSGPTKNWVVVYSTPVFKAKITISCDAAAGGTATVDVLSTSGAALVTRASFAALGPL